VIGPLTARLPLAAHTSAGSLRGTVAVALAIVVSEPRLWVLGIAGFLLRGGWLILAVPIWTVPSPVGLTTLIGADAIGTGGLSPALLTIVVGLFIGLVLVVVLSAVGAAWVDVVAFEHFVRERETLELRAGREPAAISASARRRLVLRLVFLYAGALVPAAAALLVTALAIAQATYQDFLLPGPLDVPLVVRVVGAALGPLLVLIACLVFAEGVSSVGTRGLLARRFGVAPAQRHTVGSAVRIAALSWITTLLLIIPGIASTLTGWAAIRSAFLAPDALSGVDSAVAAGGVTLVFVGLWAAALVLAGVSSVIRSALWSGWWLRDASGREPVTNPRGAASS
jgi:hypothetical protein